MSRYNILTIQILFYFLILINQFTLYNKQLPKFKFKVIKNFINYQLFIYFIITQPQQKKFRPNKTQKYRSLILSPIQFSNQMGNITQCSQTINQNKDYQFLGKQNHFLYKQISHFKYQKYQNQHIALKKITINNEKQYRHFYQFIQQCQKISEFLPLTKVSLFKPVQQQQKDKSKTQNHGNKIVQSTQITNKSLFKCTEHNFLFKSNSQQFFQSSFLNNQSSQNKHFLTLNLEYLQQKHSLKFLIKQKSQKLKNLTQNNKINKNILLELQNKIKLCQYSKIDNLPHKQRQIINIFFNELEILRIVDQMMTVLYGLKTYDIIVDSLKPQLIFSSQKQNDKFRLFMPQAIQDNSMSNFDYSLSILNKWIIEQQAKYHHNWNLKEKQLISYIHPNHLNRLTEQLLKKQWTTSNMHQSSCQQQNSSIFFSKQSNFNSLTNQQIEQQNIFSLGLIIVQLCFLQPEICSKLYQVSTFKVKTKKADNSLNCLAQQSLTKQKQLTQQKQNLTLKLNQVTLKKYLSEIKNKYSERFFNLVEKMLWYQRKMKIVGQDKQNVNSKISGFSKYEQIIQELSEIIQDNVESLKSVYNNVGSQKTKSLSKNKVSQKNSRKSSPSRQASYSGVTNNASLTSNSSLSMLPAQSQQKVSSLQLLKKNCKHIQKKAQKLNNQNHFNKLQNQFHKNQTQIKQLILKDQQRILEQLNRLQNIKNFQNTKKRFNYRKMDQSSSINNITNISQFNETINKSQMNFLYDKSKMIPNEEIQNYGGINQKNYYGVDKNNISSYTSMNQSEQKQRGMNSTTKTKKMKLQKAKQQQAMGKSICKTIQLNQSKTPQNENMLQSLTINDGSSTLIKNLQSHMLILTQQKIQNNPITIPQIKPFYQDSLFGNSNTSYQQNFSSKSQLKNLIQIKSKKPNVPSTPSQSQINSSFDLKGSIAQQQEKNLKELKSKELYEIYMNQYKNMAKKQFVIQGK